MVSALPTTSILPKAHVLNQRTMEILGDVGVAEPIYAKSTPAANMSAMGWYAGFAGPDPDFGRLIGKVESWGCGYTNLNWIQASPCRSANLPQIRLEPIMKARAEELNPGRIRFHHELIELEQQGRRQRADQEPRYRLRVHGEGALPSRLRRRSHHSSVSWHPLRGPGRDRPDRYGACFGRPVKACAGSGRIDPMDLVPRYRRDGGARAHGA